MATVEFKKIEKSYGATRVVKGVDLQVADGELVVLVGPSGCGKSTLLRMIAGLEEVSRGELLIDGEIVNDRPPRARDVAMVFQSYALYPHMTVRRNLAFALEVRKTPRDEVDRRVADAAEMLGLTELLDRYPRQLSGGQRQRVAMGRAIVRRPKVFLFDEPLSNLDASLRSVMRVELARLHRRLGVTMVYVTHDQVEAMTLADRIAVLEGGVLQQVGTPHELYDRPRNKFVASFMGSPSMNFLSGSVRRTDGGARVTGAGFDLEVASDRIVALDDGGREVIVGVRPHDFDIGDGEGIGATVDVIEPMGWESLVYVTHCERTLVVHSESEKAALLEPGSAVQLSVSPDRIHLFDAGTERSLAWS